MGNSIIERFWSYFNICVRNLTDKQYQNVADHIQHIAWAWNTTVHGISGVRPFEVMTGTSLVTLTDAMVLPPLINADINLDNIREAAAVYTQYAREHGNYERKRRTDILNKHGRELKALKVGNYVKIYVPPSHSKAMRCRRKAKHI